MRRVRGFTLIEILVVVFIVGIIAGFAVLTLGGRALDDQMQEETRRLHSIFRLAAEEATITGLELGWLKSGNGYRFLALGPDGWLPYGESTPLRPRSVIEPMRIEVEVGDLPVPTEADEPAPQIMFMSSGELTPFSAAIGAPDHPVKYRITGDITGQMKIDRVVIE